MPPLATHRRRPNLSHTSIVATTAPVVSHADDSVAILVTLARLNERKLRIVGRVSQWPNSEIELPVRLFTMGLALPTNIALPTNSTGCPRTPARLTTGNFLVY